MKARQHKETAKKALKGKWGIAIGVYFIYAIISNIIGAIPEEYSWLLIILLIVVSAPLSVGYSWFYLDVKRLPNPKIETLFAGFKGNYIRNLLASVLVTVFTLLWTLLLIIPGIIKGFAYSMTLFILRDHQEMSSLQAITESRRLMNGKKKNLFFLMLSFIWWYIIPIIIAIVGFICFMIGITSYSNDAVALALLGTVLLLVGLVLFVGIGFYVMPY